MSGTIPTAADVVLVEAGADAGLGGVLPEGARVIRPAPGMVVDADRLRADGVTIAILWPSTAARLAAEAEAQGDWPAALRAVHCAGEALPRTAAQRLAQRGVALRHGHAPLATMPMVLSWGVEASALRADAVPVGRSHDGVRAVDATGRVVPLGTVGRLQLRDAGGAWEPTDDLARIGRDGLVDLVGSGDGSVWLRGRRLAPTAVRDTLLADREVLDVHVGWRLDADRGALLVAWLVLAEGAALRDVIARLPADLAALTTVAVESLPLHRGGSVDEAALDALGLPDAWTARRWHHALLRHDGVRDAAVLVTDAPRPQPAHWERPAAAAAGADAAAAPMSAPIEAQGPVLPPLRWERLGQALVDCARAAPSHGVRFLAADGDRFLPYPRLLDDARRVLAGLRAGGARPRDPVLLLMADPQACLTGFWACVLGGMVPVPMAVPEAWDADHATARKLVNTWTLLERPRLLAGRTEAGRLSALHPEFVLSVVDECIAHAPAADDHAAAPDDLALLLLTSGSTGTPKAVMHTHRTVLSRCEMARLHHGLDTATVSLNWLPLDHVGAIVMFHVRDVTLHCQQLHAPTDLVIADPLRWLDWMDRWRVTISWAPNFAFGLVNGQAATIERRRWDLSALAVLVNAGEAIVPATARRFLDLLAPHGLARDAMCPEWGMSETSSAVVGSRGLVPQPTRDADAFADLGAPCAGTTLRIVEARASRPGSPPIGRLQVRGASVTPGYFRNPGAMAEAFTADGWFDTGDLGFLRDGRLTLTGRAKDCVIVNGVNLYSHEIEAVAERAPGLQLSYTAACAHRPAGADTDEIVVFFVPAQAADAREVATRIRMEVAQRLGVAPRHLVPLAAHEVPKTAIGKIQRPQLQARFAAGEFAGRSALEAEAAATGALPDCLAALQWRRADGSGSDMSGPWLVAAGTAAARERFADALRAGGAQAVVDASPAAEVLAAAERVLWLGCEAGATGDPVASARSALHDLDGLLAAAGLSTRRLPLRLLVVTRGCAAVGDSLLNVGHAGISAWLASRSAEHPLLRAGQLDLDMEAGAGEAAALPAAMALSDEALVAWRRGKRWVPRLTPLRPQPLPAEGGIRFLAGSTWLLAGGLGGIGRAFARKLAGELGVHLLLVGRRPPDAPDVAEALAQLQDGAAPVRYLCCDIADAAALRAAVHAALAGRPLAGIIQATATGSLADQWAQAQAAPNDATINDQAQAKLAGSVALAGLLADWPQAAFIGCSSVTASFGAATLAGYAAANAFLSTLCQDLRRRGHRAQALEWSMWRDTGLSAAAPGLLAERTAAQGYEVLAPGQGVDALLIAAALGHERTLVGVAAHHPAWRVRGAGPAVLRTGLQAWVAADASADWPQALDGARRLPARAVRVDAITRLPDGTLDPQALAGVTEKAQAVETRHVAPATAWEHKVHAIWAELLQRPRIGTDENFFELGGHSLLLTQVRVRLSELAGRQLPMVDLFRQPTIARLASWLEHGEPDSPGIPVLAPTTAPSRQQAMLEQQQRRRAARAPAPPDSA